MFKKKCKQCGKKVTDKYRYCPSCGASLDKGNNQDWGMLGKSDFIPLENETQFPRGFNTIFNSLMKNFDKQFRQLDKERGRETIDLSKGPKMRRGGISISISTAGDKAPEIKVRSIGNDPIFKKEEQKIKEQLKETKKLPHTKLKLAKLPKEEPPTNIRRLADKVVYEINMPGVKSIKDVSIIQLENSIEIKAVAKGKAYIKLIPINLPIIDYQLEEGKLVLELEAKS